MQHCISTVPGNRPYKETYKEIKKGSNTPISLPECGRCGHCASVCPVGAISVTAENVTADAEKCMMCVAGVAGCPVSSRILPHVLQAGLTEILSPLKGLRRENDFFK